MRQRPGGDVLGEHESLGSTPSHLLDNILRCEQPIICAINGDCIGLAATIALMCDITVASETARIADTHVARVDLSPATAARFYGQCWWTPPCKRILDAWNHHQRCGCGQNGSDQSCGASGPDVARAIKIAQELADGPTWAIRWTKMAVNKWIKDQLNLIYDMSHAMELVSFYTEDHKEATRAFTEKRKPKFTGK